MVPLSRNSRQLGEGKSRELGGHLSQGRFLFFLDADDQIPPGAIRALLRGADNYDIVDGVIEPVSISGLHPPKLVTAPVIRPP